MTLTKSKINKLGERIRKEKTQYDEAKLLDDFRASYGEAFKEAITELEKILSPFKRKVVITNRQTKTSISIKEKLIRLKTRLNEMQDIRECRIVTNNLLVSDKIVKTIETSKLKIIKNKLRRDKTGYRAIHIIVEVKEKPIEIQIRTELENFWSNFSERYSSKENDLKYGVRNEKIKNHLARLSKLIEDVEEMENKNDLLIKKLFQV